MHKLAYTGKSNQLVARPPVHHNTCGIQICGPPVLRHWTLLIIFLVLKTASLDLSYWLPWILIFFSVFSLLMTTTSATWRSITHLISGKIGSRLKLRNFLLCYYIVTCSLFSKADISFNVNMSHFQYRINFQSCLRPAPKQWREGFCGKKKKKKKNEMNLVGTC